MSKVNKKEKKETIAATEVELLKNQLVRALADYDNLKKRIEKDQSEVIRFAGMSIIVRLLPIIDMLEQAQEHLNDSGLAIVIKEFKDVLLEDRVEEIKVKKGDLFDENTCEAVESMPCGEDADGTIAEVSLKGYKYIDGPVLRHAKVKVCKLTE